MTFRVTQFSIESQAIRYATKHNADIFRFQQQITSGLKFVRPSESPIPFRQVSSLNNQFGQLSAERETIQNTESLLNSSVSQLLTVSDLITSASSKVQSAFQATDASNREGLAVELEGILNQLQTIANSQFNGEHLYAGTKTNNPPFEFGEPSAAGRPISVAYNGTTTNGNVPIGDGVLIDNYYDGLAIFGRSERSETLLIGQQTGAQIGTGTDTLTSRAQLQVIHDTTIFSGASGVAAGTSSANDDTIIGSHSLTIVDTAGDGSAGTLSLNGGPEVPFDNTQTNLQVEGPLGQTIFVDTTAIASGFNGTVSITSLGFLSVDDGATQIPIDFSSNQIVTDSITGGFVTIDSSGIDSTGVDLLEFPGTSNVFELISNIIDDLRGDRELSSSQFTRSLDSHLSELENVRGNVLAAIGSQSTSLQILEDTGFRKESLALQTQTDASDIQGTDFSEAALQLANANALLEYTFAVTAQITSINILDFLR